MGLGPPLPGACVPLLNVTTANFSEPGAQSVREYMEVSLPFIGMKVDIFKDKPIPE